MSAPHDPWEDVQPFKLMILSDLQSGASEATLYHAGPVDAARAADAARHQQEIAAKDAELDKLRVFLGDASPKSDALRRQFDAEIATLRATVEQQAARLTALEQALRRKDAAIQAFLDLWPIAMEQINGAIVLQSLRAGRDTYTGPNLGPQIEALRQALETAPQGGSNG